MGEWNERPNRQMTGFVLSWWAWALLIIFAGGLLTALAGWAFGWFAEPLRITSPENVREQWQFAYQYEESLNAAAQQVCIAEKAVTSSESANERTQRKSQLLAYETNYTRIQAEYNARLRNAFEAKLVKPADVPDRAPTLEEAKQRVCSQ